MTRLIAGLGLLLLASWALVFVLQTVFVLLLVGRTSFY